MKAVSFESYADEARGQCDRITRRLSNIGGSFRSGTDRINVQMVVLSCLGNLAWLAAVIVGAIFAGRVVNSFLLGAALVIVIGLIAVMFADQAVSLSYYTKIRVYERGIARLKDRVSAGKSAIGADQQAFWNSEKQGWNYPLNAAPSVFEEAESIESTVSNLKMLKIGILERARNIMFFAAAAAFAVVSCAALYPVSAEIMRNISKEALGDTLVLVLNIAATALVTAAEIILAKLAWSWNNCTVSNLLLLAFLPAPIAFLILVTAVTAVVMLVIGIVSVVLSLLAIALVCAIAASCCDGG